MLLYSSYYTNAHDTTTAIGIINKYVAAIQTNVMTGDKPLGFWLNSCPKAYSNLSVLVLDLLAAPASQVFVEQLFSVCRTLSDSWEMKQNGEISGNESLVESGFFMSCVSLIKRRHHLTEMIWNDLIDSFMYF